MISRFAFVSAQMAYVVQMRLICLREGPHSPFIVTQKAKPEHPGRWFGPLAFHQNRLD